MSLSFSRVEEEELEELLYRFAWKWAVLAFYAGVVFRAKGRLPEGVAEELSFTKSMIDSGCYSVCEVMKDLRSIEAKLFPYIIELGRGEVERFLSLLSKAINGTLTKEELDLEVAKPILIDCRLPCICDRRLRQP